MSEGVQNVILLTVDALRADHTSAYGYDRETTPFLEELARNHTRFAYAYAPSSHTRESIHAILTGEPPLQACTDEYRLAAETVASRLSAAGVATGGFHSNPYASRAYGYDGEFETFDDDLYLGNSRLLALAQRAFDKLRNRHYARAETINERSLAWLDSLADAEPFFLWNHYMDVHGPYEPPAASRERFTDATVGQRRAQQLYRKAAVTDPEGVTAEEQQLLVDLYDGEIRATDAALRSFFESLEERGLLADSLVIVTADHGEGFGEHGYYGHPRQLDEALIRVPLIVCNGGFEEATVTTPTSLLQLAPTVLAASNAGPPSRAPLGEAPTADSPEYVFASARGQDDNAHLRRFAAFNEHRVGHLVRDGSGEIIEETYDEPAVRSALRRFSETEAAASATGALDGSDDIERRLEALGYK